MDQSVMSSPLAECKEVRILSLQANVPLFLMMVRLFLDLSQMILPATKTSGRKSSLNRLQERVVGILSEKGAHGFGDGGLNGKGAVGGSESIPVGGEDALATSERMKPDPG